MRGIARQYYVSIAEVYGFGDTKSGYILISTCFVFVENVIPLGVGRPGASLMACMQALLFVARR